MNLKRILSTLSVIVVFSMLVSTNAEAADSYAIPDTPLDPNGFVDLQSIAPIVDGGEIRINGETNKLYCVFDNQHSAIENLKLKTPTLLRTLAKEYGLTSLCDANWKDYRESMYLLFESENRPSDYDESNIEFRTLRAFFDIYENVETNQRACALAEIINGFKESNVKTDSLEDELALLLPYNEPLAQSFQNRVASQTKAGTASFNVTQAIDYAISYATSPNTPTYYYFSHGDCANFVSQILENAGVSQIVTNSTATGWWHKRSPGFLGIGYTHTHSESWSIADTFARYQGIMYSTTSNYYFSFNLSNGKFVVADFQNDGDWDHCGFVTQSDNYMTNGYFDYKIAQHTSNYHAWASSSTNNWETIGSDGGKYARVRT